MLLSKACVRSGVYIFQTDLFFLVCVRSVYKWVPRCIMWQFSLFFCLHLGSLLQCRCTALPGDRLAIRFHFGICTISSPKDTHSVDKPPFFSPDCNIYPFSPFLLFTVISRRAVSSSGCQERSLTHTHTHTHTKPWKGLENQKHKC